MINFNYYDFLHFQMMIFNQLGYYVFIDIQFYLIDKLKDSEILFCKLWRYIYINFNPY